MKERSSAERSATVLRLGLTKSLEGCAVEINIIELIHLETIDDRDK